MWSTNVLQSNFRLGPLCSLVYAMHYYYYALLLFTKYCSVFGVYLVHSKHRLKKSPIIYNPSKLKSQCLGECTESAVFSFLSTIITRYKKEVQINTCLVFPISTLPLFL